MCTGARGTDDEGVEEGSGKDADGDVIMIKARYLHCYTLLREGW